MPVTPMEVPGPATPGTRQAPGLRRWSQRDATCSIPAARRSLVESTIGIHREIREINEKRGSVISLTSLCILDSSELRSLKGGGPSTACWSSIRTDSNGPADRREAFVCSRCPGARAQYEATTGWFQRHLANVTRSG